MNKKKIYLCAISNISSGYCSEDCSFCTQSAKHKTDIERYRQKPIDKIVSESDLAVQNGAFGFCLVTSGVGLDKKKIEFVSTAAKAVREKHKKIRLIGCNGIANIEQLTQLKEAGVNAYNHNLETEENFYNKICTTHSWSDRLQTCKNVNEVGLNLICGGIFGMGESWDERKRFLDVVASLNPKVVPLNFFHPNDDLSLKQEKIKIEEALEIITYARGVLPDVRLMVAGGREVTFGDRTLEIFDAGANAIVIGDYLTTKGERADKDKKMLVDAGYEIADS